MTMTISGTLIWYYYICHREVWLMSRQLEPAQENPFIEIGRLISEETYQRDKKQIRLENMVIDLLRREEQEIIIGEVKKSSRFQKSALMQLAFYLKRLKEHGIEAKGQLLFPKEKKKLQVELTADMEQELQRAEAAIRELISQQHPPPAEKNRFCPKCGYNEFCWA
jgi:CRISPR-associated exonuclease Cas4